MAVRLPQDRRALPRDGVPGRAGRARLRPADDDYFVLKPKHSGFFDTTLDTLLDYLGAATLILTGVAGNICVLFTRQRRLHARLQHRRPGRLRRVEHGRENDHALRQIERVLKGDCDAVRPAGPCGARRRASPPPLGGLLRIGLPWPASPPAVPSTAWGLAGRPAAGFARDRESGGMTDLTARIGVVLELAHLRACGWRLAAAIAARRRRRARQPIL